MVNTDLAYIALGSNLGDSLTTLRQAHVALEKLGKIVARSSLYDTTPIGGPAGQKNYLNAVIALEPCASFASPLVLLKALLKIEQSFGRERRVRWDARTLDLDLLAYGNQVLSDEHLTLPHPRMLERTFVLVPLCELNREWQHPITQRSVCDYLKTFDTSDIRVTSHLWDVL